MNKSVPDRLAALGEIYRERNKIYKDNYFYFGKVLLGMFPKGVELRTEVDLNRFALFLQLVHKLTRYARSINSGGHADSLDDLAVYSMMLQEYDDGESEEEVIRRAAADLGNPAVKSGADHQRERPDQASRPSDQGPRPFAAPSNPVALPQRNSTSAMPKAK